jgi:hypothetical protein|tara:strand:+ start:618 stop:761 length:144 start_codon:yes stop_codon:yes gene_type:complete
MTGRVNWGHRPQDMIADAKKKAATAKSSKGLTVLELAFYRVIHAERN